jgi:SagB-type dehydrogenase family enzyme
MQRTDLKSPVPRRREVHYSEFEYKIKNRVYLPAPELESSPLFFETLARRETNREFAPLPLSALSSLLWYSAKCTASHVEQAGFRWTHRPAPSAGGRHPIDLIVTNQTPASEAIYLYDPVAHTLCELNLDEDQAVEALLQAIEESVPFGRSTVMLFVAQVGRTLSKYRYGESLIWRDSGCLLATIYLVATALGLQCCGLGITGEPWISRMFTAGDALIGVGGCLCGAPISEPTQVT